MTPTEAWSAVVAGEDAAIYAYSVAGGRVSGGDRRRALSGLEAHRRRRSRAAAIVTAAGGTPPAGSPAYELPDNVDRARAARRVMADVDVALVPLYADAAAMSTAEDRRWAARCAADSATSAVAWGQEPQAFPTPRT